MSPTVNPRSSTTTNATAAVRRGRTHGPAVVTTNARTAAPIRRRLALKGSQLALATIWDTLAARGIVSRQMNPLPTHQLKAAIFRYLRRLEFVGNSSLSRWRENHAVSATELATNKHILFAPAHSPPPPCLPCLRAAFLRAPISPPIPFDNGH
jgi:hypothetical protein